MVLYDPGGSKIKQVIACSPNPMDIRCPANHKIEIINGNYGRFTITLCNNHVEMCTIKGNERNCLSNELGFSIIIIHAVITGNDHISNSGSSKLVS